MARAEMAHTFHTHQCVIVIAHDDISNYILGLWIDSLLFLFFLDCM